MDALDLGRFGQLIEQVQAAKLEIDLARIQCLKPRHLYSRTRRSIVQAVQAIVTLADAGVGGTELYSLTWILDCVRNPENSSRPPAQLRMGEFVADLKTMTMGSGCDDAGHLRPDTCIKLWNFMLAPLFRGRSPNFKAHAGIYDFPAVKTAADGKLLGSDGKPLEVVPIVDPESGETVGSQLRGKVARITDDYDDADLLEHLRCQVADWSDALGAGIDFLQRLFEEDAASQQLDIDASTAPGERGQSCSSNESELKRGGRWFDAEPPPDSKFVTGPLEGTLKNLEYCLDIDQRTLRERNGLSSWWVTRVHGKQYRVWCTSQAAFAKANQRQLAAQGASDSRSRKASQNRRKPRKNA